MYKGKKVISIIPARGRNDGIAHMNMRELGGKPLIYYTIKAAKECEFIDKLVVSTEDESIAKYCASLDVEVPFLRSADLSGTEAVMEDIIDEMLAFYSKQELKYDCLLNLYPNAPFKSRNSIIRFAEKSIECDIVIPVFAHKNYFWEAAKDGAIKLMIDKERSTRKKTVPKYEELGGIYAYNLERNNWKAEKGPRMEYCELDFHDSRMVNSVYDLILLDKLVRLPKSLLKDLLNYE